MSEVWLITLKSNPQKDFLLKVVGFFLQLKSIHT